MIDERRADVTAIVETNAAVPVETVRSRPIEPYSRSPSSLVEV